MATIGFQIPFPVKVLNPEYADFWEGPYVGNTEIEAKAFANLVILPQIRTKGRFAKLIINGRAVLYWYKEGIADSDLIPFQSLPIIDSFQENYYTAINGQTVFNSIYTVNRVAIYYNGSKLDNTEFTATDGTTITLSFSCKLNDKINVVGYSLGAGISIRDVDNRLQDETLQVVTNRDNRTTHNLDISNSLYPTKVGDITLGTYTKFDANNNRYEQWINNEIAFRFTNRSIRSYNVGNTSSTLLSFDENDLDYVQLTTPRVSGRLVLSINQITANTNGNITISLDDISNITSQRIIFGSNSNLQSIGRGTFDNGTSGNNGVSLFCSVGYELNWQGGHLSNWFNSLYVPILIDSIITESSNLSSNYTSLSLVNKSYVDNITANHTNWNLAYDYRIDTFTTIGSTGQASIDGTTLNIPNYALGFPTFVPKEIPYGLIDGVNTTYILVNTPTIGTEHIFVNGILMQIGDDYIITGPNITFTFSPQIGEKIVVTYYK